MKQSALQIGKPKIGPMSWVEEWLGGKKNVVRKEGADNTDDGAVADAGVSGGSTDEIVNQLLAENPGVSAPTFLNLLKSKGIVLTGGQVAEADSASSNTPSTRAGTREADVSVTKFNLRSVKLSEGAKSDNGIGPTKFKTILIQEGMGNLGDLFYYTKECLESAVSIFEGKKIYADHPAANEEQTRPERSVRDILGYFENVHVVEAPDGRVLLEADVKLMDGQNFSWARDLMRHSVDYAKKFPDKDFVGLSINASGDADEKNLDEFLKETKIPDSALLKVQQAKEQGAETIRVVNRIVDAISCDLVTEAGAGGKILSLIEQEKQSMATKKTKESEEALDPKAQSDQSSHDDAAQDVELMKKVLAQHFGDKELDEAGQGLMKKAHEAAKGLGMSGEEAMKCAASYVKMHQAMNQTETAPAPEEKPAGEKPAEEKPKEADPKESETVESLKAELAKKNGENVALSEKLKAIDLASYLDKKLVESKLPRRVTDKIRESIGDVTKLRDEKVIDKEIKSFLEGFNAARGESGTEFDSFVVSIEKGEAPKGSLVISDCLNQ